MYSKLSPLLTVSSISRPYLVTSRGLRNRYGGSWKQTRRLQNPDILKDMPTEEYVKENSFKRTRMVYACGFGATGALGIQKFYKPEKTELHRLAPNEVSTRTFRRLPMNSSDVIRSIACGYGFTIIAAKLESSSHTALGFGLNNYSQLGYHATRPGFPLEIVNTPSPIVIPTRTSIVSAACGRSHSLLLNEGGEVFALGNNSFGQCGRPVRDDETYFGSKKVTKIEELPSDIEQVFCGQDHSMFVTSSGELYACGWGADGQTGLGHYKNQHVPTRVMGDLESAHIVKVSSSADTVLALDNRGNFFGWGNSEYAQFNALTGNDSEQFGEPRHLEIFDVPGKIVDVAAGGTICAVLNDRGQVFVWGYGMLGKGPEVEHLSYPTLLAESLFGINAYNPEGKVEKIYAGLSQMAAITSRGDLYAWGRNRGGSLGFAHGKPQYFPMQVNMNLAAVKSVSLGVDHTCAIVEKIC